MSTTTAGRLREGNCQTMKKIDNARGRYLDSVMFVFWFGLFSFSSNSSCDLTRNRFSDYLRRVIAVMREQSLKPQTRNSQS